MDFYRRFLALPLTERRHSIGPTLIAKRVNPPPPVISITRSSSSSEFLAATIRPFLIERDKKIASKTFPKSRTSVSSSTTRSFPFRCCGARKHSSQIPSVEQTPTDVHVYRKSSTPSIPLQSPSSTLIQNHQKTKTKTTVTSITTSVAAAAAPITKSISPTKKDRRRGGMASTCTSCVSSNHSRRRSSQLDDVTPIPAHSSPNPSSQTPPLLIRLGQIILRRRIATNTNHNRNIIANNKTR
ncbi:unnamed protein product [Adineta steineri]|uniref:Uncharacterized protein n=1 Tax=Adineta steineri TaxID=433720 RepID=A0A813V5L7_9BILA|nr:unnamed protein product [Adineta steineri]CAF3904333.1 unnamed protein product [Adineta steineri]